MVKIEDAHHEGDKESHKGGQSDLFDLILLGYIIDHVIEKEDGEEQIQDQADGPIRINRISCKNSINEPEGMTDGVIGHDQVMAHGDKGE